MNTLSKAFHKYGQAVFVVLYLAACALTVAVVGSNAGHYSVYKLPAVNILQVLIYPLCMAIIFVAGLVSVSAREGGPLLGMLVSVVNFAFRFLLPIALRNQARSGWTKSPELSPGVRMQLGYYILYALTVVYLMLFFVQWRLKRMDSPKQKSDTAE
jgi:hypothetical protein